MSSGHSGGKKASEEEANRVVTSPKIVKRLSQKPIVDRDHDVPYVAGYSKDGKTIYIDRHFRPLMPYRGRKINILPFLLLHEMVEKACIDELKMKYQQAHGIAWRLEDRSVEAAGIRSDRYEKYYKPFVKADAKEKLVKVPHDLDLTPYKDTHDYVLLQHLQSKMNAVK